MSYCRWSSDNYHCDLYCYESSGGHETHVAGYRRAGEWPDMPPLELAAADPREWERQYKAHSAALEAAPLVEIGGPHDGESFCDKTLPEFRDRLLMLREAGYRFPDYVLEEVDAEIKAGGEQ